MQAMAPRAGSYGGRREGPALQAHAHDLANPVQGVFDRDLEATPWGRAGYAKVATGST